MSGRGRGRKQSEVPEEPEPVSRRDEVGQITEELENVQVEHQSVLEATSSHAISAARGRGFRGTPLAAVGATGPNAGSRGRGRGVSQEVVGSSLPVAEAQATTSSEQLADQVMNVERSEVEAVVAETREPEAEPVAGPSQAFKSVHMKPKELGREPVIKVGTQGTAAKYSANFIRVKIAQNKGYFEYRVDFNPQVECVKSRKLLLRQCDQVIGVTKSYDGRNLLYLPVALNEKVTDIPTTLPGNPGMDVTVNLQYVKKLELVECVQFYNVLLNTIQRILGLVEMGRNFYDPRLTHAIPQHKLEIWPGYVTRIDEVDAGLMLCLDASHRVLRKTTAHEILEQLRNQDGVNYKEKFKEYMIGKLVVTQYKHDCYRIDDIAWNTNPTTTFQRRNTDIRYVDYYKQQYDVTVNDLTQPLLVSQPKKRRQEKPGEVRLICLIPELCYLSGLSDEMAGNFQLMKDMGNVTRIAPQQRVAALEKYIKNVNSNEQVKKLLDEWGITFEEKLIHLDGRIIGPPDIEINSKFTAKAAKADFSREVTSNACYNPIALREYVVICTKQDKPLVEAMLRTYTQVCGPLGIKMGPAGRIMTVDRVSPNEYRKVLKEVVDPKTIQMAIVVLPSARDDLYGAVKQYCIVDCPIPSQVLLTKTIRKEKQIRSVMQKVALQINCKLGGAIWSLGIPLKTKIMFVGVDVYHDPKRKNPSVTALVATMDTKCTSYFSRIIYQKPHQETGESIKATFCLALAEYHTVNGCPPERIIIFRDGISDGQWEFVKETEVQQLLSATEHVCQDKMPLFTFVAVQKRISERFFAVKGGAYDNPPPGSVLDHTVNRKYYFDFFIVSQLVRQGTVSPTHFVVLEDTSDIKPDLMQKFAFATTYMYFNWPGTIRVPAMCQYAHKLAYLAGQHLKHEPSTEMERLLYYL